MDKQVATTYFTYIALLASKWYTAIPHTVHSGQASDTAISQIVHYGQAGGKQLFCIQCHYGQTGGNNLFHIQCTMGTYFFGRNILFLSFLENPKKSLKIKAKPTKP